MLYRNVLRPSVDWPCDLLSPANVLYRFDDLASYKTFYNSDDKQAARRRRLAPASSIRTTTTP